MTPQSLVDQYLGNLTPDLRQFSEDVMGYDTFASPWNAFMDQFINQSVRPEFLQYQYNPAAFDVLTNLQNTNQQMGLSGGWRSGGLQRDFRNEAGRQQLGLNAMMRGQSDVENTMRDQVARGVIDPLYNSQMQQFYESNLREGMPGSTITGSPQINTGVGTGVAKPLPVAGGTLPQYQQQNMYDSLIAQYMGMPKSSNASPYSRLV